ncbi:MAG: CBS domain-containing protein [Nitrospina sp.]|jgi:signal-transduction protein with cAMP-binding, CBS, and nucleotidyltransferase domain|nr:CBS domain-containing protein [Nitrospina sp.]MBT3415050.1 CBS domain-containing protein [Nitrospina sp.]MBT3855621.1 CBS domain-containing protein [Nitrospina sp.]MBT4104718.1 CBS domain-containing protein [Nitrospina sp.]MBT4390394.1 CBS domain-containing protein [Nitrospina sp.]
MSDKQILEIMQTIYSIHPDASVEEAVQKMSSQGTDALLIKHAGEYTGIFTKTDLIKLLEKNIDPAEVSVSTVMSKPILSLDANTSVKEARQKMIEKKLRHYAVTQNGKITGLISILEMNS